MKRTPLLMMSVLLTPLLTSFVLLGNEKAKLGASLESPTIDLNWSTDGNAPSLTSKEKYKDGSYASYSDEELTPLLIQEAIDQWNNVRGSYLRFQLQTTTGVLPLSTTDKANNIVVKKTNNASEAAHANPVAVDGIIDDCDITINDTKTSVSSFMETVTHEIGHCVGLGHPHSNYGAIMSYSRGGSSYRLSSDDKAGAIYLYPDPAYGAEHPKELVACGSILGSSAGPDAGAKTAPLLFWFLSIPIITSLIKRRLVKVPARVWERSATSK